MLVSDVAGCPISFEGVSFQFWDNNNSVHVKIWQFTHSVGERHTWVGERHEGWKVRNGHVSSLCVVLSLRLFPSQLWNIFCLVDRVSSNVTHTIQWIRIGGMDRGFSILIPLIDCLHYIIISSCPRRWPNQKNVEQESKGTRCVPCCYLESGGRQENRKKMIKKSS